MTIISIITNNCSAFTTQVSNVLGNLSGRVVERISGNSKAVMCLMLATTVTILCLLVLRKSSSSHKGDNELSLCEKYDSSPNINMMVLRSSSSSQKGDHKLSLWEKYYSSPNVNKNGQAGRKKSVDFNHARAREFNKDESPDDVGQIDSYIQSNLLDSRTINSTK